MKPTAPVLPLLALFAIGAAPLRAQNTPSSADREADRRVMEELSKENRLLRSDLDQLLSAQLTLTKKIAALEEELRLLRADNARDAGRHLTRDDLKRLDTDLVKLANSIKDVDKARIADNEKLVEQLRNAISEMAKIAKLSAQAQLPLPSEGPKASQKKEKEKETEEKPPAPAAKIKAFTHKVAAGETPSAIIKAYNDKLKEEGVTKRITLDMVLKANPTLKPERMQIGQEILIPDPRD